MLEGYESLDGIRLNMVVSSGGSFTDSIGSSRGISNAIDRKLLAHLRKLSDVVITGGETARVENYEVPSSADLLVISSNFEIDSDRFFRLPTPEATLDFLRESKYRRILLETGPSLSGWFLERDLVDEFCLTVVGGNVDTANEAVSKLGCHLKLVTTVYESGTLFTVWRRG